MEPVLLIFSGRYLRLLLLLPPSAPAPLPLRNLSVPKAVAPVAVPVVQPPMALATLVPWARTHGVARTTLSPAAACNLPYRP